MTHLTTPRIIVVIITLTTLTLITPTTTSTLQPQSHKSLHSVPFHNMLYDHTTAQFHPLSPSHERHLRFLDTTITLDTDSHTNQTALINHFNRIHNDHKHRLFDKLLQRFFTFKPPLTTLHIDQIVADLSVQSPRHLHWVSPATLLVTLTRDHPLTQQSERPIDDLITRWSDSLPLISHFFPTEKLKLHPFLGQFLHAFPEDNTATVAPSNLHHHLQFDSQTSPAATKHIRTRNNEMLMEYIVNSADESPRPRMNKFVGLGHPDSSISLYIIPTAHATRQMYQLNSLVDHLLHHTRSIMTQDGHDHDANAVKLVVASPNKLLLTLSCSHIKHALNPKPLFDSFKKIVLMLALHPDVHFIEPQLQMAKLNKFAHWVTQSNRNNDSPFWDAGLQGQGQIVGCADTGIDYDSCYFIDHNVALPVNRIDMNHRKIVSYTTEFADQNDYESGHGTHVVGSIAGDAINGSATAQSFNGMAPKAKLAFTDICVNQCQTGLNVPSDMSTKLFPTHYNAGARIDSNSWGSNLNSYTSSAREVDEYTYANQDYLVLIAAGNTGPNYFTVSSPATSKNCIAVGASFNALESFTKNGLRGILISSPPSVHGTYLVQYNGFTSSPDNVDTIQLSSVRGIFYTDNALGCNNWSTDQKTVISSRVLFVRRGQCFFTDKVRIGLEAGAVAVVVVNDRDGAPIPMGGDGTGLSIPSVMMDKQEGEQIISALGSGPSTTDLRVDLGPQVIAPPSKYYSTDNMASFSSRGPTQDARLKPDLVAPGYRISSAKSDGNQASPTCSDDPLTIMGTSMATPVSAGTLALIRQYFAEGFYPSGKRNPADAKVISGVLLKAVALTATRSMISGQAGTSNGRHLSETPSYDQGYGRLELEAALPLNGSTTQNPNLRLVVVDTEEQSTPTQVSSGEIDKYYLTAGGDNIPLVVTLTWFDPPASLFSGMNLINNLDLHVVMPNGSYIVGNHKASSAVGVACKMTTDSLNNVERVIIDNPPSGTYVVSVHGTNVPTGPQRYALAMSGDIVQGTGNHSDCPNSCSGNGDCIQGLCQCYPLFNGFDCSATAPTLFNDTIASGVLSCDDWTYFAFDYDGKAPGDILVTFKAVKGDPDLYIRKDTFPTQSASGWKNIICNLPGIGGCIPGLTSITRIRAPEVGRYIIGVHGYASDIYETEFQVSWAMSIKKNNQEDDSKKKDTPAAPDDTELIIALAVSIPGGLAILIFLGIKGVRRMREQGFALSVRESRRVTNAFAPLDGGDGEESDEEEDGVDQSQDDLLQDLEQNDSSQGQDSNRL